MKDGPEMNERGLMPSLARVERDFLQKKIGTETKEMLW